MTGSIIVYVMTHPDYRFQGMFKKIGRYSLASAADSVEFSTGYPIRKEVMPGHLSIGWIAPLKMPVLVRPLSWSKLARRFNLPFGTLVDRVASAGRSVWRTLAPRRRVLVHQLSVQDAQEIAELSGRAWEGFAHHVRSPEYLVWRYFRNPVWQYRVYGVREEGRLTAFVVTRDAALLGTASLAIVDMACDRGRNSSLQEILSHVLDEGRARGLAVSGAMVTRGNPAYLALRRAGFFPGPHRFTLILYGGSERVRALLADPAEKWFLMWGGTDAV